MSSSGVSSGGGISGGTSGFWSGGSGTCACMVSPKLSHPMCNILFLRGGADSEAEVCIAVSG